jgi:hypothetical protein
LLEWALLEWALLEWALLEWALLEWALLEWALLIRQTKFTELKKNALTQKSYPLVGDSTLLKIPRLECAPVWLIF